MKNTKTKLLKSALALLLTVAMLVGSTFAWFTDSVTSKGNVIQSGSLDIEMYWTDDVNSGNWYNVEDAAYNTIFSYDNWEPGHTDVKYIKLVNNGDLAMNYKLSLTAQGSVGKLAEVINVYFADSAVTMQSRDDLSQLNAIGLLSSVMNGGSSVSGTLLAADQQSPLHPSGEVIMTVAMHMITTAGNEYQNQTSGEFTVTALATQAAFEKDSFGADYDANAEYPEILVKDDASAVVTPVDGKVPAGGVTLQGDTISAFVPEGVKMESGANKLTLTVTPMEGTTSDITVVNNEILIPMDVHIEGVAADNTVPIVINLGEVLPKYLNMGNYRLFHVENGANSVMTLVDSAAELTAHNSFTYDPMTGAVSVAMATFSEVALLADTANVWQGNTAEDFGGGSGTEADPYLIGTADQLAYLSDRIANDNENYSEKHYKLLSDIDFGDKDGASDVIFHPIGYYYTDDKNADGTTGDYYSTVYSFEGVFDGNGHTIANFYQNTWEIKGDYEGNYYSDAMGLFGYVVNGTIKNLTVDNFSSDGEFTPTGVIAAYAVNSTFENIAITNCNPRVYNTGNGGIVGIGGSESETEDPENVGLTFENITIDKTNKITALWGSWDVACGGLVGMFRGPNSVWMKNCHVGAQIDVYNDVCGNYQYYWYRYSGMMVGTNKNMVTDDNGYTVPETTKYHAEGCTVHFGDWNDYYYCELVANSLASYTHDHQFSRLQVIDSLSEIQNEDGTWKKTGNFILFENGKVRESGAGSCYHIMKDADGNLYEHKHDVADDTNKEIYETVNGESVLKENNQRIYLPFNQLFTGYGWGVKHIPVYNGEDYAFDGITILDREVADSVQKFEKADTAEDEYPTETAVTIGDLFKAAVIADSKLQIKGDKVQVTVSPVGNDSTVTGTYVANTTDWTQGTLTFNGLGAAIVTITDYYFCTPTTISVGIDTVEKFQTNFTGDFLYRVGNAANSPVALGTMFAELEGVSVNDAAIDVEIETLAGNATGEFTADSSKWESGKIQFSGTGIVKLTIAGSNATPVELVLEVVDAKNITTASSSNGTDVVLLNDVTISSGGTVNYTNCTVYGNGFMFDVRGGMNQYNSKQGHGIIIASSAVLDNLVVLGDVYDAYGAYTSQEDYTGAIDATNTTIQNCHISNCSTPIRGNGVTVKNTTLYGGTVANLIISGGVNTLENVTTVNYNDGRGILGFGIVISDGANENVKLVLNGELKQYNFVCAEDASCVPDSTAQKLFNAMFDDAYSAYHITSGETTYVNPGILSMVSTFDASDITNNTGNGYVGTTVSYNTGLAGTATGYLYSLPAAGNAVDNGYNADTDAYKATTQGDYLPKFNFNLGDQAISNDGADDTRYLTGDKNGVEVLYQNDEEPISLDLTKLAIAYKYDGITYGVSVSYKDASGNVLGKDTTVSLTASGTLEFTVVDNIFYDKAGNKLDKAVERTYIVPVTVSVKQAAVKNAEISFKSTSLTGTYTAASIIDTSQYLSFNPLDAITVTDYDANGTGTTVDLTANISSTTVTYVNTTSGAWGGATITMTYTDGRVLTIVLGSTSMNSPGSSNGGKTITVTNGTVKSDGKVAKSSATGGTWPITSYSFKGNNGSTVTTNETVTVTFTDVNSSSGSGCLAEGTMITLADGSCKPIEQITYEDELLAWDFNTGKYAVTVPSLIETHEKGEYRVINLNFADGTVVKVVVDHGFFDVAENNFVYIDEENVDNYIGHNFVKVSGDGSYETVALVGYEVTVETICYYNIQTAFYNNCIAENMFTLNAPPEVLENDGWFDYFKIGDDMKYDEAKMQADIEKYGLYDYSEFAEYVTYEQFLAFNGPYLKVLVGRGVLTFEDILALIPMYVK